MLFASLFITAMLAVVSGCGGDKPATSTPEVKTPPATDAPVDPAADEKKDM
jgi:hypothetical protein